MRRFVWAVPRSLSTAFERWVIERGDHHVIDEPFSAVYYLGPERVSDRFGLVEPESTGDDVRRIVENAPSPTFVKDMVHHVPPELRSQIATMGRHTLLTRDPTLAIPSFAQVWPDVTWEECGYEALVEFADHLDDIGLDHDVIDADDLMRDPESTLRTWANGQGLDFDPATLTWEAGMAPQWTRWREFHHSSMASRGFEPRTPRPIPAIDDARIAALVERAAPLHQRLLAGRATS